MEKAGRVGIGRIVLSSRERAVMVEPRGGGMLMRMLRGEEEVRKADFGDADGHADPDMVAVAETIIERRAGEFDPSAFRDRYQDALRELVESKVKGKPIKRKSAERAAQGGRPDGGAEAQPRRRSESKPAPRSKEADRRQAHLLLPVEGGKGERRARGEDRRPSRGRHRPRAEKGVVSDGKLDTYRHKRDFTKTAEPSGDRATVAPSNRLRFVDPEARRARLHYDLRLELDGVFKSWAVTRGPSLDPARQAPGGRGRGPSARLRRFRGHDPQGPIWRRHGPALGPRLLGAGGRRSAEAALAKGELKFRSTASGCMAAGCWCGMKHDRTRGKRTNWLLIKHRDAPRGTATATRCWKRTARSLPAGRWRRSRPARDAAPSRFC